MGFLLCHDQKDHKSRFGRCWIPALTFGLHPDTRDSSAQHTIYAESQVTKRAWFTIFGSEKSFQSDLRPFFKGN